MLTKIYLLFGQAIMNIFPLGNKKKQFKKYYLINFDPCEVIFQFEFSRKNKIHLIFGRKLLIYKTKIRLLSKKQVTHCVLFYAGKFKKDWLHMDFDNYYFKGLWKPLWNLIYMIFPWESFSGSSSSFYFNFRILMNSLLWFFSFNNVCIKLFMLAHIFISLYREAKKKIRLRTIVKA